MHENPKIKSAQYLAGELYFTKYEKHRAAPPETEANNKIPAKYGHTSRILITETKAVRATAHKATFSK